MIGWQSKRIHVYPPLMPFYLVVLRNTYPVDMKDRVIMTGWSVYLIGCSYIQFCINRFPLKSNIQFLAIRFFADRQQGFTPLE